MRLGIIVLLAAAALAVPASAAGPVNVSWPTSGPLHLLFVGDSLTDGALAVHWQDQLRYQVLAALRANGPVAMTTRGKGGVTVAYWAARPMPPGQNLAIVELGTNDARENPAPTAAQIAAFGATYRKLVAKIRDASPRVQFVCLSVWHPVGEHGTATPWNAQIKKACPGAYANITPIGATKAHLGPDHFHPNDIGHEAIGAAILKQIHVGS